jgi:hypothetical protein
VRSEGRWRAVSDDGIAWGSPAPGGLPSGWRAAGATAFAGQFLGIGSAGGGGAIVSSADGRHWMSADWRPRCGTPDLSRSMVEPLAAGAGGLIAQGFESLSTGNERWLWCTSGGGRVWLPLDGYPPFGASKVKDECRDVCPNGIIVADGEKFIAYRGVGKQAAWASLDGRNWDPLAVAGTPPGPWTDPTYPFTINLLPIGLLAQDVTSGAAWIGALGP